MKLRYSGIGLLIYFVCVCGIAVAQLDETPAKAGIKALLETDKAHPGELLRIAVLVTLAEGWHVNSNKPLDEFLIPTVLTLEPQEGITLRAVGYPESKVIRLSFSPEPVAVYAHEFAIGMVVDIGADKPLGEHVLNAKVRYQSCNDTQCLAPVTKEIPIPIELVSTDVPLVKQHAEIFEKTNFGEESTSPQPETPKENFQESRASSQDDDWRTNLSEFTIAGRAVGYMDVPQFMAFLEEAESGVADTKSGFENKSIWVVAVLTILGGLALNLTPCVLPLIPINLAIIGAGARGGSRTRGFALGGVYGAGIALAYGILGIIVVLTTSAFGAINASPWFNLAIAAIFVLLSLAMFEVFTIDFSRYQANVGIHKIQKKGFALAFFMGAVSAVLGGACVAPAVIAVILFARDLYANGNSIGLALPFVLGAGMALPWPVVGAGLSFLPKPGKWMVRVRQVFGVLILGFAVYYGYLAYDLFSNRYFVNRSAVEASAAEAEGWTTSLAKGLAVAAQERKPVLLDFWATWCKSCMVMNRTTLKNPEVVNRLGGYVKIKYQAETPDESPAKEVLEHFGVLGLPTYVVLIPNATVDTPG